jgi:hypothetical protein
MDLLRWIFNNFGFFFGMVFLIYLFLIIRRLTHLYDMIRQVPVGQSALLLPTGKMNALNFLAPLFDRLRRAAGGCANSIDPIVDAIWSEVECRVSVHFSALNGYVNTLILVGFAGTIFGSIGAFNEMFQGLARGETAAVVFVESWNNGLATALYTSLGAAAIGGSIITLLCSRFIMVRAKRLETIVGLRISEIIEEEGLWRANESETASFLTESRTPEKTSLPISS